MSNKMLKFIFLKQRQPKKRPAEQRKRDFFEIYRRFTKKQAMEQASRCSQCGVPYCSTKCPVSNYIPNWLKLTTEGRFEEAFAISSETNSFPEICGRICPQDRLCEGNCVIESGFNSVTIGAVEAFITDNAFKHGLIKPIIPQKELNKSIGIIGAGPCGMAAANILRQKGYRVAIYDRYDRAGGLMTYGIPTFKLEKNIVQRRQKQLEQSGVDFHFNTVVTSKSGIGSISFKELYGIYDAVFIATGTYKKKDMWVPGSKLPGVVQALDYLIASQKTQLSTDMNAKNKHVIVIGGGDTAMDCLRTAIRQGAKSVKCMYRRDEATMPGSKMEVKNAKEEGVEFIWQAIPETFIGGNCVQSITALRTELEVSELDNQQTVKPIENTSFNLPVDMVIKALGFAPEPISDLWDINDLSLNKYGNILITNPPCMTSIPGVFAGGDIVRGASLAVWAIKDGQDAAHQISQWLENPTFKKSKLL
ncbi:NAD(P)-dependent oxidoreductase [Commensalibacter sp. Nvir]|uniref:NAD(P)-dependent oxidoreductase n=1 Tax=Commensalibacter sp. Nvir TaxID=3069817 RepID=UPI0030C7DACC